MKKLVFLSLLMVSQLTHADIMKNAYRNYDAEKECYIGINKDESGIEKYCMTLIASETVFNHELDNHYKTYYFASGNNLEESSHAAHGNIGIFIEDNGDGSYSYSDRLITHKSYIPLGSWGYAPKDYEFRRIGKNSYAFFIPEGFTNQGTTLSWINIFGDYHEEIFTSFFRTGFDNSGYSEDESESESLNTSYKIIEDDHYEIYPIQVIFDGTYEGQTYNTQTFMLYFDETNRTYQIPDNYPLN